MACLQSNYPFHTPIHVKLFNFLAMYCLIGINESKSSFAGNERYCAIWVKVYPWKHKIFFGSAVGYSLYRSISGLSLVATIKIERNWSALLKRLSCCYPKNLFSLGMSISNTCTLPQIWPFGWILVICYALCFVLFGTIRKNIWRDKFLCETILFVAVIIALCTCNLLTRKRRLRPFLHK